MMEDFKYIKVFICALVLCFLLIIKAMRFVSVMSVVSVTSVISDISVITPQLMLANLIVSKSYES